MFKSYIQPHVRKRIIPLSLLPFLWDNKKAIDIESIAADMSPEDKKKRLRN